MQRRRSSLGAIVVCGALAAAVDACRTPTQATLVISTDAACVDVKGVAISVAPDPQDAERRGATFPTTVATTCDGGSIGTLVVTPGELGETSAVIVTAGIGVPVDTCKPPAYAGCIVARRRFTFAQHVKLSLPIELNVDCRDVPCDALTTCRKGKCVDSEVVCGEDGCSDLADVPTGDDGPLPSGDAGPGPLDASPVDASDASLGAGDASTDSGDGCPRDPSVGNAWGQMSCMLSDGNCGYTAFCIAYTIGRCADEGAYGEKCANMNPPIDGPPVCSQDPSSTTYRCLHEVCARGCVPGGSPPNYAWVPVYTCVNSAGCGQ